MKILSVILLAALPVLEAGCAHPLEQIVDANHQARIDAANARQPLARGASDGLGTYIAATRDGQTSDIKSQP